MRLLALTLALLAAPGVRAQAQTIEELLVSVTGPDRARVKAQELCRRVIPRTFSGAGGQIKIREANNRGDGLIEVIVSFKITGQPIGLGALGWEMERVRIQNPPIKTCVGETCTEDPQGAIEDSIAHTVGLISTGEAPATPGIGHTTLTVYPDAGTGVTTVDGQVSRTGANEAFTTIRAGAGTSATATGPSESISLTASTTTDQFAALARFIATFDTSSLGAGATIDSATLSLYGNLKANVIGAPDLHVVASSPAANNTLATTDYGNVSFTSFANVTYAAFSAAGYNDLALDANGIANVNKTGISRFGAVLSWDLNNSFTGTWSSGAISRFRVLAADTTGTTQDPKLTVVYSIPPSGGVLVNNGF